MRQVLIIILALIPMGIFAQEIDPTLKREARKLLREGNELYNQQKFSDAEVSYKKALANDPGYELASYNLGNALSQQDRGEEAIAQYQLTAKLTKDKMTKSEAYHNIGNTHFDAKKYQEAVDAYKNSLRNNWKDEETRYNLALAQKMLEDQQQQQDKDNKDNKDNKDDKNQDKKDQKNDENKDDQQDKKDDQQDGDDKNDDQNDDQNKDKQDPKDNEDQQQNQKPQPGKLSPQQIQQLLEAMNNEEKKTQEKMNARKEKGKKIKQEKDW